MSLPSGVVTFMFSDIEGSTRLWESDPSGMRRSLARHDEIFRGHVADAGGHVFKHTGDGFAAAFESGSAGLAAAATVSAALASEPWDGPALAVRIGLNSGEAEPVDGDYFGSTVTRSARVMDAGNGGQVIVSDMARQLVGDQVPPGAVLVDQGEHRLKDLGEPIRLHCVVCPGAEDDRPLRTLERAPHNLPIQLSTFVGRAANIKEVTDLVRESRLVTLTGIGGVGKTRLSLQVAAELLGEFEHGAWFVELAGLGEAGLLADTVSSAVSVPPDSTVSAEDRLLRFLSKHSTLLVIDNCEHLIDDVADFVDRVLRMCPDVHILTTSREGLAVTGEVLWRVPSLGVDDDADAVELFAERARLVQPGFVVTEANLAAVAELCVRLDGIPLAIELATARLKMLTVDQISQHLGDRFRLLTGGSRTAVERQRTLKAMMDWSYDLLSSEEQALLRRLAVFYDGFTLEAAEEVCSGETLPSFEVLDLLGRLVEASIVTFDAEIRPRYRLLETVRQYALDKLVEADEADEARERHAEHFRTAAVEVDDRLHSADSEYMKFATDDLGNYRAAMTWAIEAQHGELALQLGSDLRTYFWNRVMYRESVKWLTAALELVDDDSPSVPRGLAFALTDASNLGDEAAVDSLRPRAERLLSVCDGAPRGLLSNALASACIADDVRHADQLFRDAHLALREAGSRFWTAPLQNRMLSAWFMSDTSSKAEVLELVSIAESENANVHGDVVRTCFQVIEGEYTQILDFVSSHTPVDEWEEAMLLGFAAHAARALGRFEEAERSVRRAHHIFRMAGRGSTFWELGMLLIDLGRLDEGVSEYTDTPVVNARTVLDRTFDAHFFSMVAEKRGDFETSAMLAGYAQASGTAGSVRPLNFDLRRLLESQDRVALELGADRYQELRRQGGDAVWEELPLVHP
jgi:predicted ATPase/class 3 adenylate cyclase